MNRRVLLVAGTCLLALSVAYAEPCPASFSVEASDVFDVAVDETNLYFSMSGTVWRMPLRGGKIEPLAHLDDHHFMTIAVDEDQVYVNIRNLKQQTDSILAIPKGGGVATELLRGFWASAMIPDGDWLYLLNPGTFARGRSNADGAVVRVRKDGAKWEKLARGLRMPMGMVLDGDLLYVSERGTDGNGGISRLPKTGGRAKRVAKLPWAMAMAQDESNLYVATMEQEHEGSIYSVPKQEGRMRTLVEGIRFELILPLKVFDGSLYFGTALDDQKARLEAIELEGGTRRTIAEVEGGSPYIAVDRCGVYYSTSTGVQRSGL